MSFATAAASLAERTPLPDFVIRAGMRRVIAANDACITPPGTDQAFARAMSGHAIAEHADAANRQPYELPPAFFALFLELWTTVPFPVPAAADIDAGLRDQLVRYRDALGTDIPVGAVLTFLRCWMVLYGAVAMEVFGHIRFALEDPAPMFELTLGDLAALVGLRYPRPA